MRPRAPLDRFVVVTVGDVARVVLVDVELPVEAEEVGVRAHKALDVRARREGLELLLLEGADVLRADLRRELDLRIVEPLAHASLAQAVSDLEHQVGILEPNRSISRGAVTARTHRRQWSPRARNRCPRPRGSWPCGSGPNRPRARATDGSA